MEKLKQASKENRVEQVVKHYLKYTVLIIDEIGYLPVDKAAAYGFFQLIAARYEFRPTILTTNQSFSKWPDVFGDAVIANAIIEARKADEDAKRKQKEANIRSCRRQFGLNDIFMIKIDFLRGI